MTDNTIRPFLAIGGTRYPLARGGGVRPFLNYSPTQAFPDTVTFGDASKLTDQRTRALVYSDARGGMGEYQGPNGQLPAQQSFTLSDCDTRFERSLVLPPAPAQLGASAALAASATTNPWYVEYLGAPAVKLLAWQRGGVTMWGYDPTLNSWTARGGSWGYAGGITAVLQYGGRYLAVHDAAGAPCLHTSLDGITWSGTPNATGLVGGVEVNALFWAWDQANNRLTWTTDPTTDPASTTVWARSSTYKLRPQETVQQLVAWKNPRNEPAVFLLTNQRLIRFDQDLDTPATPGFYTIHDFGGRVASTVVPRAYVWPRDQQLYVTLGDPSASTGPVDSVLQFGPASVSEVGPNIRGGIPVGETFSIGSLVGGYHWLYGFAQPRGLDVNTRVGPGRVLVMNGLMGWHSLAKGGGVGGINGTVAGGGYANGLVWLVTSTGYVYELRDPDVPDLPVNLQSGTRSYLLNTTCWHEFSWHGGGMENIRKVLQHLALDARDADVPGLPSNTEVIIQYRLDGTATWINALNGVAGDNSTGLGSAATFPAELPLAAGLGAKAKRLKFRLGLASTNSAQTPNVASFEAHFVPKPREHYAYRAQLDLLEGGSAFPNAESQYGNQTAQQLLTTLLAVADGDTLTTAAWGGDDPTDASYTSLAACQVKLSGNQDADTGNGLVTVTLIDLTPPPSGG